MEKTKMIMMIVLGALILLSGVQAYQLVSLKNDVNDAHVSVSGTSSGISAPVQSAPTVPDNVADLPQMVGGC